MPSIIKVDQIQSDTGSINLASSLSGNLTFSGTGKRILGDFNSSPIANRTMFQTTGTNAATNIYAIPNGTATTASFSVANNSDASNSAILQVVATATEHRIQTAVVGTGSHIPITFYTSGVERLRIPVDAAGITFPATQAASSDPNTLDDYEEGAYTPTLTTATGTPTYQYQEGRYVKIGKFVHGGGIIGITNSASLTGSIKISIPFTTQSTTYSQTGGSVSDGQGFTFPITTSGGYNAYTINLQAQQNTTYLEAYAVTPLASTINYNHTGVANNWYFRFCFSYIAAS
jgi:hypothetical protein